MRKTFRIYTSDKEFVSLYKEQQQTSRKQTSKLKQKKEVAGIEFICGSIEVHP